LPRNYFCFWDHPLQKRQGVWGKDRSVCNIVLSIAPKHHF
jgi:hypothetical protein